MARFLFGFACALALLFLFFSSEKNDVAPPDEPAIEAPAAAANEATAEVAADSSPAVAPSEPDEPPAGEGLKIYLTVDDGPSEFSADVLRTAQKTGAPMAVFLVGEHRLGAARAGAIEAYRREPLIELANHSFCHANNDYDRWYSASPWRVVQDFQRNQAFFGLKNRFARLPGRGIWALGDRWRCRFPNGAEAAKALRAAGFEVFGWDVEWPFNRRHGWPSEAAEAVVSKIEKRVATGDLFRDGHVIVLLHERHFQRADEVERLIARLRAGGCSFEALRDYPR